jgi:phage portal protein BeeE
MMEEAMERDLLTADDRTQGVVIRFNVDAALRADFKSRQEGLRIQREAGVISPNDWREREGMNPIDAEQGGDTYWQQGPSGQTGARNDAPPEP